MTTSDLLATWREATRTAERADQLAAAAAEAVERADLGADVAEEIAELADRTATAAFAAAQRARLVAIEARELAVKERAGKLHDADEVTSDAHTAENEARDAYHGAEGDARTKHTAG